MSYPSLAWEISFPRCFWKVRMIMNLSIIETIEAMHPTQSIHLDCTGTNKIQHLCGEITWQSFSLVIKTYNEQVMWIKFVNIRIVLLPHNWDLNSTKWHFSMNRTLVLETNHSSYTCRSWEWKGLYMLLGNAEILWFSHTGVISFAIVEALW